MSIQQVRILLVFGLLFSSVSGKAIPHLEPIGLSVSFKSKEQFSAIDKVDLHKQMGFRLLFESEGMNLDFVTSMSSGAASISAYEESCRRYLRLPMVRFCRVEYRQSKK